jgi:hypothetical protein
MNLYENSEELREVLTMVQNLPNAGGEIPEGYIKPEGTLPITENGTKDVTNYAEVDVNIPIPTFETEEITIKPQKGSDIIKEPTKDGFSKVTVEKIPDEYIIPEGSISITENTTKGHSLDVSQYAEAVVNVPIPTFETEEVVIEPQEGDPIVKELTKGGFSKVTVNPIKSDYIGSAVTKLPETRYTPSKQEQEIASGQFLAEK